MTQVSLGGALAELSDDDLLKGLNGWPVKGYSESALRSELAGEDAPRLVERCMAEDRLKKKLVAFPDYITDQALKDEVIEYVLTEPGVWLADETSNSWDQAASIQANYFARNALREAFQLDGVAPELQELQKALQKKSTRHLIANLYHGLTNFEAGKRARDSREMNAAVEDLRQIIGMKTANPAVHRDAHATPSQIAAGKKGIEGKKPRTMSKWIVGASVAISALAGFFAFRKKAARA